MKIKNNTYLISVVALTIALPLLCTFIEWQYTPYVPYLSLFAKWFLFSAVGLRLLMAGLIQLLRPEFTLHHIFKITDAKSTQLVQEIGLHNLILGAAAILTSLLFLQYQFIIALMGSAYFGSAGLLHMTRKHKSFNQQIAMISDLGITISIFIFLFL